MMTREELVSSREYWIAKIQLDLYNQLKNYMDDKKLSQSQLAEELGVTKGYISQILNGDFDHRISKLVDLALAIGYVPIINYEKQERFVADETSISSVSSSSETPVFKKAA